MEIREITILTHKGVPQEVEGLHFGETFDVWDSTRLSEEERLEYFTTYSGHAHLDFEHDPCHFGSALMCDGQVELKHTRKPARVIAREVVEYEDAYESCSVATFGADVQPSFEVKPDGSIIKGEEYLGKISDDTFGASHGRCNASELFLAVAQHEWADAVADGVFQVGAAIYPYGQFLYLMVLFTEKDSEAEFWDELKDFAVQENCAFIDEDWDGENLKVTLRYNLVELGETEDAADDILQMVANLKERWNAAFDRICFKEEQDAA